MLATYSVRCLQDASELSFVALYVGNLQRGMSPRRLRIVFCSIVCWQPTAWDVSKMPSELSFVALYVGNLQREMSPRRLRIVFCSIVCWQPTAWDVSKTPQNCLLLAPTLWVVPEFKAIFSNVANRIGNEAQWNCVQTIPPYCVFWLLFRAIGSKKWKGTKWWETRGNH